MCFWKFKACKCVKEEKKDRSDRLSFLGLTGLNPNFFSTTGVLSLFSSFFFSSILLLHSLCNV